MNTKINNKKTDPEDLRSKSWDWVVAGMVVSIIGIFVESLAITCVGGLAVVIGVIGIAIAYDDIAKNS